LTGNIRDGARIKLSHYGLYHYFRLGGFGDEHHDRDDVAREVLRELQGALADVLDLDRVWVIGDTPFDVQCARAIGARAAAVATGWHTRDELAPSEPDLLFEDLSDAAPLLKRLG
jgi:phosphoglycolate phosphatase-like HAD superfamily hydrolase